MKKELFTKGLLCIVCVALILGLNYLLFTICLSQKINLVTTYIASKDISPRSEITEEDIVEVQIPQAYLESYAYTTKKDIVGKYTDIQGKIPAGSIFYKAMLYEKEELKDKDILELRNEETIYTTMVDVATIGSLVEGECIDIHVNIKNEQTTITGKLIENARVSSIKDHQGVSITDETSNGVPYLLEIIINKKDIDLLMLAETLGTYHFYPASNPYDASLQPTRYQDSKATQYLESLINEKKEA